MLRWHAQAQAFQLYPSTEKQKTGIFGGASTHVQVRNATGRDLFVSVATVKDAIVKRKIQAGVHAGVDGAGVQGELQWEFVPLDSQTSCFWVPSGVVRISTHHSRWRGSCAACWCVCLESAYVSSSMCGCSVHGRTRRWPVPPG
jgi:hypothetical protein